MPSIVIVADDGTKFELPEESASFSDLLRGAMEQWTQRHDAATTPSSLRPQTDGADGLALSDEDDSTAEDVGRNWPLGGDDASTCSQLSDFPEEDRYFQGASTFGLKQSVERLPPEGSVSTSGAADGLRRRQVGTHNMGDEDDVIRLEDDVSPTAPSSSREAAAGSSGSPVATAAGAMSSDTDSDRTASIAPDVDSRSHSTSSSQGSVGMTSGMGGWTPPRSALPGVVVSPGSGLGAPRQRRVSDGVKVGSSSSSASSGSSTTSSSSSDSDSDASTSDAEEEEKGTAAGEEAAPLNLPGPRDNADDSVTPSSLSEEEEERGLDGDDDDSNEVAARVSGTSSNSTGARRSVSVPQDGETLTNGATAGRGDDAHSNASTPELLSPSQREDVVGVEEEVGGELRLGSPLDGEGGEGKPSRASVKSSFVGSPKGMKKDLGSEAERLEGHPHAGALVSSTPASSGKSASSSNSRSGGRKSGNGGTAGKTPVMSLRERLEDASLKHRSDSDSSEDEDGVVERVRHLGVAAVHSNHRDPRSGLTSPHSSEERGSAGRRSDGSGGRRSDGSNSAADSVSSVRKAYTVVVNAAEPLEDDEDDDEDDIGIAPIEDEEDEDAFGGNAVHTPREDLAGAVPMRSPVDAGTPSSIAATLTKGNSHNAHNFHQRTPVMIGVDEECVQLLSSEGHATIRTPKEGLDVVAAAPTSGAGAPTDSPSPSHTDVAEKVADVSGIASVQTAGTSGSRKSSATKRATAKGDVDDDQDEEDAAGKSDEDDADEDAILYKGAVISKHKIVVDLVHSNTNSTPSQGVSPRTASDGTATTSAILGGGGGGGEANAESSTSTPGSSETAPPPLALPVESVRLCVAYLQHFATNVMSFEAEFGERPSRGGGLCRSTSYTSYDSHSSTPAAQDRAKKESATRPSELPMPLTQPLVALLTDWETDFLFTTVLQVPATAKEQAQRAMSTCPNFDMRYPGMYLQKEPAASELRDALRMPAPEKAGLARLKSLLITAKHLRIDALVQLLTAWIADYMLRVCYSGADNFEAAHLIRFCFQVQNDFNRREMEYLKIENEWPANEEE